MTDIAYYLNWWIADGCLKAETEKGTYKVQQTGEGFVCTFEPYIENIRLESQFIADAVQVCEQHYIQRVVETH